MAMRQPPPDRIELMEPLSSLVENAEQSPLTVENVNEHTPYIEEKQIASNISDESKCVSLPRDASNQLHPLNIGGDQNAFYTPNYGPQTPPFFYRGEWEEYSPYTNAEGLEVGPAGVYNENKSFPYHAGYGYSQLPYGLISTVTTPLPSVSGDGQLYSPQHFPFSDTSNPNNMLFGRPSYQPSFSFGRDWLRSSDGTGSMTPFFPPAASPQPTNAFMSSMPIASGMFPQQRRSYGFGSAISSYDRGYHGGLHHGGMLESSFSSFGIYGRNSIIGDKIKRQGKGNISLCGCNETSDFLTEHNRGPRANRSKDQLTQQKLSASGDDTNSTEGVDRNLYNHPDFVTVYKDAKFFVIKSYSEDNVHKSIKYGVWASTSHGNKRLDSSYRESKAKEDPCPVFLFFSVNASAHFCGVAEMVGPVDFEKSVDYWQQDKWSGQFPVKWHIVKDIPNSLFRHIILENNDNKPVTNSRDTQEVKLEQGLEMLRIFAKHEYEASILDDLEFYEEQEKALLERRARHQQHRQQPSTSVFDSAAACDEKRKALAISGDIVNQMPRSFADAVRLEDKSNEDSLTDKSGSLISRAAAKPEDPRKPEDGASSLKSS